MGEERRLPRADQGQGLSRRLPAQSHSICSNSRTPLSHTQNLASFHIETVSRPLLLLWTKHPCSLQGQILPCVASPGHHPHHLSQSLSPARPPSPSLSQGHTVLASLTGTPSPAQALAPPAAPAPCFPFPARLLERLALHCVCCSPPVFCSAHTRLAPPPPDGTPHG